MSDHSDGVARRYAYARPHFELVGSEDVAIPMYWLKLDAIVQERNPIPTVEQFLLRGADAGIDRIEEIAGFLGLEAQTIKHAVARR
jgi:hypothetical protein